MLALFGGVVASVLLGFAAAFLVLFEPDAPAADWPFNMGDVLDFGDCTPERFVGYLPTLQFLIEMSLTGEPFFQCGKLSDVSEYASPWTTTFPPWTTTLHALP